MTDTETDDQIYQFETADEYKQDIREVLGQYDDIPDEKEIESEFQTNIKTATDVYYLVDKHDFSVIEKTDCGGDTYRCMIQCDNDNTKETVRRILDHYVSLQGIKVIQVNRVFLVSQLPQRSYLYMALFEGTVVEWIHRLRKLIL